MDEENAGMTNCLDELLDWYGALTPASLAEVGRWYHPDATFRDPFNQVQGHAAIRALFLHMFATTDHPGFEIMDRVGDRDQAFVTWIFTFSLKKKTYRIEGGTHFRFGADGRVIDHRDYWDAAEELFEKLPLIGRLIHWLRKQFRLPAH